MLRLFLMLLMMGSYLVSNAQSQDSNAIWSAVDKLVNEQKFQAALDATKVILDKAQKDKNGLLQAEAMVRATQLEVGLGSFESAIKNFRERTWPGQADAQVLLNLYYSQALRSYSQRYRWEISRREKVESKAVVDLKAWTLQDLSFEIRKSLDTALGFNQVMQQPTSDFFKKYVTKGSYPDEIKPWFRNIVIDTAVSFFADTTYWTPTQSAEIYKVSFKTLLQNPRTQRISATDLKAHPIEMVASWISENQEMLARSGKKEAALEAQYALIEFLHQINGDQNQRRLVLSELIKLQEKNRQNAWWSRGQALLSGFYQQLPAEEFPNRMIDALAAAEQGAKAYPGSIGAKQCLQLASTIRAPNYNLQIMSVDTMGRLSLSVSYKNLRKLFFRAYKLDFDQQILEYKGDQFLGLREGQSHQKMLGSKATYEWSEALPETKDYLNHQRLVQPPIQEKGYYLIYASTREDFSGANDEVHQAGFFVSDFVLSVRDDGGNRKVEVQVLRGSDGDGVEGVSVRLHRFDYNRQNATVVATVKTDKNGSAIFSEPPPDANRYWSYFVSAKKDDNLGVINQVNFSQSYEPGKNKRSMIFVDRAVYRPGQKIQFKVSAFEGMKADYKVLGKGHDVTVFLRDPNSQEVAKVKLTTNEFGTVAGEFVIPSGRPLGMWHLHSSISGTTALRVEEYKRPTFEVSLLEPAQPLRLNKKAVIRGEAKYYFGQAVTSGKLRYRITRSFGVIYDFSYWYYWPTVSSVQVAQGEAVVDANGQFNIEFTPQADEAQAKKDDRLNYTYDVQVDLTDEGGETRSASRDYRIGFLTVEANIRYDQQVFEPSEPVEITAILSQLDGKARSGIAKYKIFSVKQPDKTMMPAAFEKGVADSPHILEHDRKRARYEVDYNFPQIVARWPNGEQVSSGTLNHGASGEAKLTVSDLKKAGVYRLHYEVQDDFGKTFQVNKEFIVGGEKIPALPMVFLTKKTNYSVGTTAKFYVGSGFGDQNVDWEIYRGHKRLQRQQIKPNRQGFIEIPITKDDRGGFEVRVHILRDYQNIEIRQRIFVPWEDKALKVEVATMRDKVLPGAKETVRLTVKGPKGDLLKSGSAEILALMYDRSLDLFAPYALNDFQWIYPNYGGNIWVRYSNSQNQGYHVWGSFNYLDAGYSLYNSNLMMYSGYAIGGLGMRSRVVREEMNMAPVAEMADVADSASMGESRREGALSKSKVASEESEKKKKDVEADKAAPTRSAVDQKPPEAPAQQMRSNFSETAFFRPQLVLDEKGSVSFEYQMPDSLTSWKFYAQAMTKDMLSGVVGREVQSLKDLMVRPYMPRFLREGDQAEIRVVVNNSSNKPMSGQVKLQIEDSESGKTAFVDFGLKTPQLSQEFKVAANSSTRVGFLVKAPALLKIYTFRVVAEAKGMSDGEVRELPILPSRMHLAQSRFVTLKGNQTKSVEFVDLKNSAKDPSMLQEKLVATVDAQLFFSLLQALPSILKSPYQCSELILNKYVTTGILSSFYGQYPQLAKMAKQFSKRKTALEKFDEPDANRRMALEESPWLKMAKGGFEDEELLANVLDPAVAKEEQKKALTKLKKMQLDSGAFPWFEGGRPDEFMTLYILIGFSRALEFKAEVPKDVVVKAWKYTYQWIESAFNHMLAHDYGWEMVTTVLFALSSYPDDSWTGGQFTPAFREKLLNFSFSHWKHHAPRVKAYLALVLHREKRTENAKLVWDSIMDSAKSSEDLGTYWQPEDRAWLWYRDTTESQAFGLRSIMELARGDARTEGFVQWLFLNKKLNQWKSTRATAEVIYSVAKYLESEKKIGLKEEILVDMGTQTQSMVFAPDQYTGKKNQVMIEGEKIDPVKNSKITFQNKSPNLAFASATWHFSTEKLPEKSSGDFFSIERSYFVRQNKATEGQPAQWVLKPLKSGDSVKVGDQVEVQLSMRSKHEAEYVHLRDPRAAGLEPESLVSGYKWGQNLSWYEEVRDSGSNFFMSWIPVGEATFKYRLRANMAGTFRLSPATVQSFYAPEFNAYSAGFVLKVVP